MSDAEAHALGHSRSGCGQADLRMGEIASGRCYFWFIVYGLHGGCARRRVHPEVGSKTALALLRSARTWDGQRTSALPLRCEPGMPLSGFHYDALPQSAAFGCCLQR
ncbi:unnamed protein product [Cercospora beticola]|nr:unnamed protein product [Cercospora beticola]